MNSAAASSVETVLRDELARADRALAGVAPVLGHVLAAAGHSLVSDAVVARVQGMLNDLARQLVGRLAMDKGEAPGSGPDADPASIEALAAQLANDTPMLSFLHALAMEGLLTERLNQRVSIDPVLSPLWQELIASEDAATSETAMQALAAQSRFMQAQRRMQQPVLELSSEALERALRIFARTTPVDREAHTMQGMRALKQEYDEAKTRIGLIARLVSSLRGGVVAALELEHAGLALFASALAHKTGQSRERTVLACHDQQAARLALALRASGLDGAGVERQLITLDPDIRLPRGLDGVSPENARAILQDSLARSFREGAV